MKKIIVCALLILATAFTVNAQQRTAEELQTERESLAAELKSEKVLNRLQALAELTAQSGSIKKTGLESIDGLATLSDGLLNSVNSTNSLLEQVRDDLTANDGKLEISNYVGKLNDYLQLSKNLIQGAKDVKEGGEKIASAKDDIKNLSPLKIKPATASLNFSTNAIKESTEEIEMQTRIVSNLIETIQSVK